MKFFHVENQRSDGAWQTFTAKPIEGLEAAEVHMAKMLAWHQENVGGSTPKVRLREMTPAELLQEAAKTFSAEEKNAIVLDRLREDLGLYATGLARFCEKYLEYDPIRKT